MGANFTKTASTWAAHSVSSLERLSTGFDKQASIHPEAPAHGRRSDEMDVKIVVDVLKKAEVTERRAHRMFPKFTPDPLHKLNREQMAKWIRTKAREHMRSVTASVDDSDPEDNEEPTQVMTDSTFGLDGDWNMTPACYWVLFNLITIHLALLNTSSTIVTTHSLVPRLHVPGNNRIKVIQQHESPAQLSVLKVVSYSAQLNISLDCLISMDRSFNWLPVHLGQ